LPALLSLREFAVIADLIRNPVDAWHWIPDQVRDDKQPVRDDTEVVIADLIRNPVFE